jgi:hypothetical protein
MRIIFTLIVMMHLFAATGQTTAYSYLSNLTQGSEEITKNLWAYTRVASNGRNARKEESKRQALITTLTNTTNQVGKSGAYEGDATLRDAVVNYYKMSLAVLKNEYGKIVDLEAIAEDSYDQMEAYLAVIEQADHKLDSAFRILQIAQRQFGSKYGINIVEDQSKISEKLRMASRVNKYSNKIYLIFFKVYKQEAYLLEAVNKGQIASIAQNRETLEMYATEALKKLKEVPAFQGDNSLVEATRKCLEFYLNEAKNAVPQQMDFMVVKEQMQKSDNRMKSLKRTDITQKDIDDHNALVKSYNQGVNSVNDVINRVNQSRTACLDNLDKARDKFNSKFKP